jgi:ABC-2 type transport system permease protein
MTEPTSYWEQIKRSFAIVKKNVRIYYFKGMVVILGLMIPFFLFLSFSIGRDMPANALMPGLLGMTVFFTAASVAPAIMPWETRARTLERVVSAPVSVWALFLGDVLASFLYGIVISIFPVVIGLFLGIKIVHPLILGFSMVLASFCFASFSILLSVYPPTDIPATVMMLSSLVKFPLVFISGIFIPIEEMPGWGRIIASCSPLTYFTDLARHCINGKSYYSPALDFMVLLAFSVAFFFVGIKLHERVLPKRLQ